MSVPLSHASADARTTTLTVGPFDTPLGPELGSLIGRFIARAISHGYTVLKQETDTHVTVTAVLTAPRTQLITRTHDVSRAEA